MTADRRVAAVDVGTNSVRLLVAEPEGERLRSVDRQMRITRLGQGVDAHGRLDARAVARTLDCLADYAQRWRALGVERARVTATSAVRDAANREEFLDDVRARTGAQAEVISGDTEAHIAFLGVTSGVQAEEPYLVVDIGGGSTEFIAGTHSAELALSRQLGCVRLTERCLPSDPPTSAEIRAALAVIHAELGPVEAALSDRDVATLVGVAGTVTTIGALHLGLSEYLPEWIHGTHVPFPEVARLTAELAAMPARQRAALGPMAPGREDVIVAGALILRETMDRLGHASVLVSEADILDGLALRLIRESR